MVVSLGKGHHSYEPLPNWARLPSDLDLGEVAGIAVDNKDRVFLFNRGSDPVVVQAKTAMYCRLGGKGSFPTRTGRLSGRISAFI